MIDLMNLKILLYYLIITTKNFGGKKNLLKLVKLNAFNWETKKNDKRSSIY